MFLLVKCTLYLKVFLFEVILMETFSLKVFLENYLLSISLENTIFKYLKMLSKFCQKILCYFLKYLLY